jgi:uncharacterized protein (TIGR03435 family)
MMTAINGAMLAAGSSLAALIVVKVTVLAALGLAAAWLGRRSRAAVRHALLAVTFGATLVLPITSLVAPPVHVTVPVAEVSPAARPLVVNSTAPIPPVTIAADGARMALAAPQQSSTFSLSVLLLTGWIVGTAVFLVPVMTALWQIRSLRRSGLPWLDGQSIAETLALDAGIHRRVEVLLHEALPGPITCGVLGPAIVLPREAESWAREDLSRAIVHELEHVRRGDSATRCLARTACALYWFHPLAWIAWRKLVLEAERSCDDAVLRRSEATAYADQLVGLAKRLPSAQRSPLLAMASRSDLSARVGSLLDGRQRRGRVGAFSLAMACAGAVLLVIVMSPLTIVAAPQAEPRPAFEVASVKSIDPATLTRDHQGHQFDAARYVDRTDLLQFIVQAYVPGGTCTVKAALGEDCPLIAGALPAWVKKDKFEIQGKLPDGSSNFTPAQIRQGKMTPVNLMLQGLLEDRFHLKVHRETRDLPVFALAVGKSGLKLKRTPPGGEQIKTAAGILVERHGLEGMLSVPSQSGSPRYRLHFQASSMQEVANSLAPYFDRPVLDRTGLQGDYDFDVIYDEDQDAPNVGGVPFNPYKATAPALSIALEEIGLKLESTKAAVEVLVVDHVEKPAEN